MCCVLMARIILGWNMESNNYYFWLLRVSYLFKRAWTGTENVNTKNKIRIKGVAGFMNTLGSGNISFPINFNYITHKFYIVDGFDNNIQGILGSDFFTKF